MDLGTAVSDDAAEDRSAASAGIVTDGLCRHFPGGVGLDPLSIEVPPGEVLALLGPNGAGKTTTVRLLNGVLRPDGGSARVLGIDPAIDGDRLRARTGVLTEYAGLDDRLTARENLRYAAMVRGLQGVGIETRIDELIVRFGMGDRADRLVRGASTGQRKRLGLARSLLHDPEVLFLDEPTSGLDPAATRDVVELIGALASEHGRTIVLATHFLGEAGRLADRMAMLDHGALVAFGRPDDLAAELWDSLECEFDLGSPADSSVLTAAAAIDVVLGVHPSAAGITARVGSRDDVPAVVRALVGHGVDVYAAIPRPPTLEDIYFEIEARRSAGDLSVVGTAP
ncbi:MAG: ABC transporter ATP-binding protein [Acidimicrobiales bacterium]|nr:ABC transporter ATP-binding protein [Acidimicrobiales bacterium]